MKKKLTSKKCIALVLAMVMVITSIPFMMVGAEDGTDKYDPAPYFSDEAIKQGADAWLDEEGNVQVKFPAAGLGASYAEYLTEIADDGKITDDERILRDDIPIDFYILELVDMGAKNKVHQDSVIKTIKVTGTSATFKAADIGKIDLENNRYSVTITAVDSEGWFSQSMYTSVSEIPAITLAPEKFEGFSTSSTAVREIMTFDPKEGVDYKEDGTVTGGQLLYMGPVAEAGTEDLTDNVGDTHALRFIMNTQPTKTQTFDTSYSRSTWDYKGATEMWYWMDLSEVELKGVSFRLRANEKLWVEWKSGKVGDIDAIDHKGDVVYSTKGTAATTYTGETPYVYVQREDGGWNKVMLNADGTVDIGNFKGYVRVPLKFMCSETATYVDISNQEFNTGKNFVGDWWALQPNDAKAWMKSMTFPEKILVDNPGTPISEALLIQHRAYKTGSGVSNVYQHTFTWNFNGQYSVDENVGENDFDYSQIGYMLAMPLSPSEATTTVTTGNYSSDRAYIANGTVQNREAGLKAIEDIYNAGFSIEGCSADSLQHSFFVDNIFFYRTDNGKYTNNSLNDTPNTGEHMSVYYDETLEISRIIFDEIDKYIEDPDWADYREINYILNLIETYRQIYESKGRDTNFLSLERTDDGDGIGLAAAASKLGRDSWEKAWAAYDACVQEGTIGSANADKDELVPVIVRAMEKLPAPENITSVSEALRSQIVRIWKAYSHLNLGQLEMLGKDEEEKVLQYVALLDGTSNEEDDFVVGQRLADNPYVVFNNFESNYMLGDVGYKLEDSKNAYSTEWKSVNGTVVGTGDLANDWRHLKNLVTYTTNSDTNITNYKDYGYSTTDGDSSQEVMDNKLYYNASSATVTNKGYLHSTGISLYSDSSFNIPDATKPQRGPYHTVTVTKDGAPLNIDDGDEDYYDNNMSSVNLGELAQEYTLGDTDQRIPLSIVFYVDFSEIENFFFTINLYTRDAEGKHTKARVNMGDSTFGGEDYQKENWKYFILDPKSGEWVKTHSTSPYCFSSSPKTEWGDTIGLNGYKGYIMVPLYHIKKVESEVAGVATKETMMDQNSTYLNNIFAVQFCIAGENPGSLDEKSFSFDNIGFTYSDFYSAYATRDDKSYAEVFNAKSLPAKNFENAVAAIDIYDEANRATKINEALALHSALPDYQKTMVADAKATLDKYQRIVNGTETLETALYTVDQFNTFVASLPDVIKNSSVSGENFDIPEPRFTNGSVNYSTMGITPELAQEIKDYYNFGYRRFSATQKGEIADKTGFLNAYNMAMRLSVTLENILGEARAFLPKLASEYHVKKDSNGNTIGNFVSIAERDDVQNFWDAEYKPLQYFSKICIDDGSIYPQLTNTSRGLTYFLKNTEKYDINEDGTIDVNGGILNFKKDMQTAYETAARKITNKEPFNETELQEIEDLLGEYNAFLPAYYNIEELYQLEQDIIALFAAADVVVMDAETSGTDISVTGVTLDSDNLEKTIYVDLSYVAARLDRTVTLRAVSDLELTQESGTPYLDFNSFSAGSLVADTEIDLAEFYNSGTSTNARVPLKISVDPAAAAAVPQGLVYNGSVTFYVYDTDDIDAGLTGEDLVVLDKVTIPVKYISTKGAIPTYYEITFPAAVTVPFGETNAVTSGDITITHTMPSTKKLTVSLSETGGTMVIDTTKLPSGVTVPDPLPAINYTATFADKVVVGTRTTGTDKTNFTVQVAQDQWNQAYVNDYIDSGLTFTVACEDVT